jgi:hypothetical protein
MRAHTSHTSRDHASRDHALTPEQQKALDQLFAWCDRQDKEYEKRRKRGDFTPRLVSHFSERAASDDRADRAPAANGEEPGSRGGTAVRGAHVARKPRRRRQSN